MTRAMLIPAAALTLFGFATAAHGPAPAAESTWRLVTEQGGQAYVRDYSLSLGDCMVAAEAVKAATDRRTVTVYCEREGLQ